MAVSEITWTIHELIEGDELPMYVIAANDFSAGYLIGEMPEVEALASRLLQFVNDNEHDGQIDSLDPILARWITARQASEEYNVPHSSITWACRNGHIHKAEKSRSWHFPDRSFRHWLNNRPGSGRTRK